MTDVDDEGVADVVEGRGGGGIGAEAGEGVYVGDDDVDIRSEVGLMVVGISVMPARLPAIIFSAILH
jgi:hypothetical protein